MKKSISTLLVAFVLLLSPSMVKAGSSPVNTMPTDSTSSVVIAQEQMRANELLNRLEEINAMDKSDLSREEKKNLRQETRAINNELKALHGGIYITAGGLILIIILLIILF